MGSGMEERDYRILEVLDQTKNITKAADALFMTQSALSKRVALIEQELGVSLFVRSRHGIHFTPEGEVVLWGTRKAAKEMEVMRERLALASSGVLTGSLNAGVSIHYAKYNLPDILMEYHASYPLVKTNIVTGVSRDLFLSLSSGNLDLAVVRGDYPWPEGSLLLEKESICVITRDKEQAENLNMLPYIGRRTDSAYMKGISRWMRENDIHPVDNEMVVNDLSTCVEMVSRGLGWAIVPHICLRGFKGFANPIEFKDGTLFERSTYVLYSKNAESLPQIHAFLETIKHHVFG